MALKAVKNANGVIIADGTDFGQSGDYNGIGTWCAWSYEAYPELSSEIVEHIATLDFENNKPLCFKENGTEDGIELRALVDIQATPNG